MSFGFSIGDIITCSQLAVKVIHELKAAPKEFEGLKLEFHSLNSTLKALADEEQCPTSLIHTAHAARREDMRMLLQNCTNSMEDLRRFLFKFSRFGEDGKEKLRDWVKVAAADKKSPREKLAVHTASLNIFLTTLSHSSLGRLEFILKNPRRSGVAPPAKDDFAIAGSGSRGLNAPRDLARARSIWKAIGEDLFNDDEGLTDHDVERFQEELKAYMRHLVRGEIPFWPTTIRGSSKIYQSPYTLAKSSSPRVLKDKRRSKGLNEERKDDLPRRRAKEREIRQNIANDDVASLIKELDSLFEIEESPVFDQPGKVDSNFEAYDDGYQKEKRIYEPDLIVSRLPNAQHRQKSQDDLHIPVPPRTPSTSSDEQYNLSVPTPSKPSDKQHRTKGQKAPSPPTTSNEQHKQKTTTLTPHKSHAVREKLEELLKKRNRHISAGDHDLVADDEIAILDTVERLQNLGVKVSNRAAWDWDGGWCDKCNLRILGIRFHCDVCQNGNWDVCEECWNAGSACLVGSHRLEKFEADT